MECSNITKTKLTELIIQNIKKNGAINFAAYMEQSLYHSDLGYYNNPNFSFGPDGDFFTASSISPIYGKCFANYCMNNFNKKNILEVGAGDASFALNFLEYMEYINNDCNYIIVEKSNAMKRLQKNTLKKYTNVAWAEYIPNNFNGVLIAHEVLDAHPTNIVTKINGEIKELYVDVNSNKLIFKPKTLSPEVLSYLKMYAPDRYNWPENFHATVNIKASSWLNNILKNINESSIMLLTDYGDIAENLYNAQNNKAEIRAIFKHNFIKDFLNMAGEVDLSSMVNLNAIIDIVYQHGRKILITKQTEFLIGCSMINLIPKPKSYNEELSNNMAIKRLLMPNDMGHNIHVIEIK